MKKKTKKKIKKPKLIKDCNCCWHSLAWYDKEENPDVPPMEEYKKAKGKMEMYLYPIYCPIHKEYYDYDHTCSQWKNMKEKK